MSANDHPTNARPKPEWWLPEDWSIVLRSLAFAAAWGKPEDCPRWRIDALIDRAERERDRGYGEKERDARRLQRYNEFRRAERARLRGEP